MITTAHPLRHPLQIIVCVGQIYGLILYYATHTFDFYYKDIIYSRPEFLYFWGYYFFMNFIWMVFPGSKSLSAFKFIQHILTKMSVLLVSSVRTIAKAFSALDTINAAKKTNGKKEI